MQLMAKYYTGIGSRETPVDIKLIMAKIGYKMASFGYTLRSGAAYGADESFEKGCDEFGGDKEIYLPWKYFNNHRSNLFKVSAAAMDTVNEFHPTGNRLKEASRKLMARNAYQILGSDLKTPSKIVICWTPDGKLIGGTAQAIRIANHYNIPVYNLAVDEDCEELFLKLGIIEDVNETIRATVAY